MTAPLPDAAPANWVDRHAPPALRPWLKLGRFDRPTGIWLLMLPGWQGIALACAEQGRLPDPVLLALFFLGAALMRAAGCAYNDIVDRDIDAKVARTAGRPIPSGQISVKQAWAFVVGCSLVSLLILVCLPPFAIGLGIASLLLVAAYPFMKRITWWPQAWLGLTFNWGALMGYAAASGGVSLLTRLSGDAAVASGIWATAGYAPSVGHLSLAALLLYLGGVAWTLGYDTIYAIQDLEDDALAGVKSSARRLGAAAPRAVGAFYLVALAAALAASVLAGLGVGFALVFVGYAVHLGLQAQRVRVDDPLLALKLFRSNTWAGVLLFVAIAAGAWRLG
jgi:4-hydroxybenzoate polyprenyltransferase